MTGKAILLNKQIWLAVGMVTFIGAVVASGTGAFFSDTADVTGNTFAAGTLDLQLTQNEGGGSPADTQSALWNFTNMAPGGTPEESSVWLRNVGSVDGATLGVSAAFSNNGSSPSQVAIAKQMRITEMTLDGNNLLVGGAGATIPGYEAPTSCDITVGGSGNPATLTNAIAAAGAGDVICATGTNYSETWEGSPVITVDKEVTIVTVGGPSVTQAIPFRVTADNVTIKGFEITGPSSIYGVYATDVDNITVTENHINDIGTALTTSAQGVYLKPVASPMTGAELTFNRVENIGNPASTVSTKGFFVGDTLPALGISNVLVANNIVTTVRTSRGAYGVLVNHGGGTANLVIENNTISDLDGLWEQGVSLTNDTPNAIVRLNSMSDFAGVGDGAAGVNVEGNPSAATVVIENNNFAATVATGVLNQTAATVNAPNNWWGGFTATAVSNGGGSVVATPIAGGPFAGRVGGLDANSNGYADLDDLRLTSITGITPGLDSYTGSNDQEFVLAVQLDGPTTGNDFQGAVLDDYVVDFSLNQI
jgi:predicted ribosomally synthesized peptide with SipW-like signal peptide